MLKINELKHRRFRWLEACLIVSVFALITQLLGPIALRVWEEWPSPGRQTPGSATVTDAYGSQIRLRYVVYLPEGYSNGNRFPLLLYLHGSGERGDNLDLVKKIGPQRFLLRGHKLPMLVVSPQCQSRSGWDSSQLLDLLTILKAKFTIDPNRIYVAGYSMGGLRNLGARGRSTK